MSLFKNKYRVKSMRLPQWDYGSEGMYFVTICTKDMRYYFGDVVDRNMILNEYGQIANRYWRSIPGHFINVRLDTYIVMPNHIHGILEIHKRRDEALPRLYTGKHLHMSQISPKPQSLSTIIGSFKSIVTKMIKQKSPSTDFSWQPRFHDHIIRNEKSLNEIREYIHLNPTKWELDEKRRDKAMRK